MVNNTGMAIHTMSVIGRVKPSTHGAIQTKLNGFEIEITNKLLKHW